jgi:glycosyltransferase involved in cell wall biosynthesis
MRKLRPALESVMMTEVQAGLQSDLYVAVVIPTLNEAESINAVITSLPRVIVSDVIVADGGSTDGTRERAQEAGARIVMAGKGYGRACLAGAKITEADIVVFMDGDGADDPSAISAIVEPIASGRYDFVIASRTRGDRETGSMTFHQILAGHIIGWLTKLLYGVRYTDMCAFRAIRRDVLLALDMRELTYGWNLEMQMRVARQGFRVLELPVSYRRRLCGASKVSGNLQGTIVAGTRILTTFARVALESIRHPIAIK